MSAVDAGRAIALVVTLAGCAAPSASLFVEVRTDLSPGIELGALRTELYVAVERREPRLLESVERPADPGADYGAGVRAAELLDVPVGTYTVAVTALDRYGEPLLARRSIVVLDTTRVVTFVLTRDCVGVLCPGAADAPSATACVRGRCVAPECAEGVAEACPGALCERNADCEVRAACAEVRCESGFCFERGRDERCAPGEWCDPASGCAELPSCDPELCDDGDPCTEDRCEGSLCVRSTVSGVACDDGVYCNGADTCAEGACTVHAGDPCAATGCSEEGRTCYECSRDSDCGTATNGAWSACAFSSACGESGQRSRSVQRPRCVDHACTIANETQTEACSRSTDGNECGSRTYGPWSACDYADACDESATRSREVTDRACSNGRCVSSTGTEEEACSRSTTGMVCDTGGTYCGRDMACYVCRGGACVVNTPHYDAACRPSCGASAALCGGTPMCCGAGTFCTTLGPGPWSDCARCCEGTGCP